MEQAALGDEDLGGIATLVWNLWNSHGHVPPGIGQAQLKNVNLVRSRYVIGNVYFQPNSFFSPLIFFFLFRRAVFV